MREEVRKLADELNALLPYLYEETTTLILRLLASLPGGEELAGLGYEPFSLGWLEAGLAGKVLSVPQEAEEVAWLVRGILKEEE